MDRPGKRWIKAAGFVLAVLLLLPCTSESYLKLKGFEAAGVEEAQSSFARWSADPVRRALGWDNDPTSKRSTLAVNSPIPPDYKRLGQRRANYLVLGCSCTFGIALGDDEGYICLLNASYPKANLDNYAVPGFGTYQMYRKLELILARNHNLYDGVLCATINDHLRRNTWLNLAKGHDGLRFIIPRMEPMSDGTWRYHDIEPVPFWPGSTLLPRTMWFMQTVYIREFAHRPYPRNVDVAAFNIILGRMAELCEAHGTKLMPVWLDRDFGPDLSEENRKRLNCLNIAFPEIENPQYQVPGDGHPNAQVQVYWRDKLAQALGLDKL